MTPTLSASDAALLADIENDWLAWCLEFFEEWFCDARGMLIPPAPHHHAFWEWLWSIELGETARSFVGIWPRGGGKSTNAELGCVALGVRQRRKYGLYICESQDQADDHVQNVASLFESQRLGVVYPDAASRMISKFGAVKGWRRNRIRTAAGFTLDALGLDTAARGVKIEDQRPDFMVFDDIDGEMDSATQAERKIKVLTRKLLPAGASNLVVLAIQNLVHPDSIFARLADNRADWLVDRIVSGPIPALRDFTVDRAPKGWKILTGTPTWAGQDMRVCQRLVDKFGLSAFESECVVAGTEVATPGGPVPIESLSVGDVVINHLGYSDTVMSTMSRLANVLEVRRAYRDGFTLVTSSHPYLVRRRRCETWRPCLGAEQLSAPEWVSAGTLRKGDYLLEPVPREPAETTDGAIVYGFHPKPVGRPVGGRHEVTAGPATARFLGYYAAEGNLMGNSVVFNFHANETDYHADVAGLASELFRPECAHVAQSPNTENGTVIRVCSPVAVGLARQVGCSSHEKRVPAWVFGSKRETVVEFLRGYWRGDGWTTPKGFDFASVSRGLIEDVRVLLLRLGIVSALGYRTHRTTYSRGRILPCWGLRLRGIHARAFASNLGIGCPNVSDRTQAFIDAGYVHYPVRSIRDVHCEMPVYNLSVADAESYLADGVAVHNCQHDVEAPPGGMFDHLEFEHCDWRAWPELIRTVVWVDPAVTHNDGSDSHGIQADGLGIDGKIYRLYSWEARTSPEDVLRRAILKALELGAEGIGIETDQGGLTWQSVCRVAWDDLQRKGFIQRSARRPRFYSATAGQGQMPKTHRAGLMLMDYERNGIVHVVGTHMTLEKALRRFPKTKPYDLVDASYWSWADLRSEQTNVVKKVLWA